MKNIYFLDTSYILALEIKNEYAHHQVIQNWSNLAISKPFLVTTTYVFDEIVTFLKVKLIKCDSEAGPRNRS
jgi:predicted nucleic acid-binding protein